MVWKADAQSLEPPYRVEATFRKRSGRIHEGMGLVFGASDLEGPEAQQSYGYFLIRGDGSFLIKKREGAATPVVQDWTAHPDIQRDGEGTGRPNEMVVEVTTSEVSFFVNGTRVAQIPSDRLPVRGVAGIRAAHEVELEISGFKVDTTARRSVQPTR